MQNQNIIPYVPIADRVQASTAKSQRFCQHFFSMVDQCVKAQISFNHDTQHGYLSISPSQINDLMREISKNDHSDKPIDINLLKASLNDLIYPKFNGELTVTSPIWNNEDVKVWQFQLNQIARGADMQPIDHDAELSLDMALSALRVWRNSLETGSENREVIYQTNDLVYKLMDIEQKLRHVQHSQFED